MDPRDALDSTLATFHIKASSLAEASGIDAQMISKYRNKRKDMNSLNVQKIVNSLPEDARAFYYLLLMGNGSHAVTGGK